MRIHNSFKLLKQETSGLTWAYFLAIHKVGLVIMESDELVKWGTDYVFAQSREQWGANTFPVSYPSTDIHCFP